MIPLVKITVSLLVATKMDKGVVLAKCPFLNIVTQGRSKKQALENLQEEINFFFESCCQNNSLVAVMDKRTAILREPFSSDDFVKVEPMYVEVPSDIPPEILKRFTDAAASIT